MIRRTCTLVAVSSSALFAAFLVAPGGLLACPFCGPPALTLAEDLGSSEVGVIARLTKLPPAPQDGDEKAQKARFQVVYVLKGEEHLAKDPRTIKNEDGSYSIEVFLFREEKPGTEFLVLGIRPPEINWGTPVTLTADSAAYMQALTKLPSDGRSRLAFFQDYLEHPEQLLAIDAYDEFAKAPYDDFVALKDKLDREKLLAWIKDPKMANSRKRLYLMLLSVCGQPDDIDMLETMLTAKPDGPRSGLEPVIVCYITLKGAEGLPLIEERFFKDKSADYLDIYSTIMALRFFGENSKVLPQQRLIESFRLLLDRPNYADLIIPDLARWEDWDSMDKLVELFKSADEKTSWVRVPVVQYLMACPLPKAEKVLAELEKIDPKAIERASFILPLGGGRSTQPAEAEGAKDPAGDSGHDQEAAKPDEEPRGAKVPPPTPKAADEDDALPGDEQPAATNDGKGAASSSAPRTAAHVSETAGPGGDAPSSSLSPRWIVVTGLVSGFGVLFFGLRRTKA